MKLSIFTDAFGCPFEQALDHTVELGFETINIRTRVGEDNTDSLPGCASSSIADILAEQSLSVNCIASTGVNPLLGGYDILDPGHQKRMEETVERLARYADELDAPTIRVYSLTRPEHWYEMSPEERQRILDYNASCLTRYAEIAGAYDRYLLVENEPPTLTATSDELVDACKRSGHNNLRVAWDPVNAWRVGEHPSSTNLGELAEYVMEVHVVGADSDPKMPNAFGSFAVAGEDEFPHELVLNGLFAHGFSGVVTLDPHYGALPKSKRPKGQKGVLEVIRTTKRMLEELKLG
ncbi:MAG TPA: sugar phosphate isomerase/epimerase [Candidatus Brocadiia bacterium]|nr:sugar phosphate isomerase/epimerase [Candidatus Brocadiia bacterium]